MADNYTDNLTSVVGPEQAVLLKHVYLESGVRNAKYQVGSWIPKMPKISKPFGKGLHFASQTGEGNATASNLEFIMNAPAGGYVNTYPLKYTDNVEWTIGPRFLSSFFPLTDFARRISNSTESAYQSIAEAYLTAQMYRTSRYLSLHVWGDQYGTIFKIDTSKVVGSASGSGAHAGTYEITYNVDTSMAHKVPVGSYVVIATPDASNGGPGGDLTTDYGVVAKYNSKTGSDGLPELDVTLAFTGSQAPTTWVTGNYVQILGARSQDGSEFYAPQGINDWLAYYPGVTDANRALILANDFNGVIRSKFPKELAGTILRASEMTAPQSGEPDHRIAEALTQCLYHTQIMGATDNTILVNPKTFLKIGVKEQVNSTLWQNVMQNPSQFNSQLGAWNKSLQFGAVFVPRIQIDPTIPDDTAICFDKNDWVINDAVNINRIVDATANSGEGGELGKGTEGVGEEGLGSGNLVSGIDWNQIFAITGAHAIGPTVGSEIVVKGILNTFLLSPHKTVIADLSLPTS